MGMFYNKLMESAVDEVIQTPDDIGVDLDAIENNIVGDDGCEAHREEIDDAMEGVVGDPLEEAATIMYESEYNFNQLMKCIGMAELNEAVNGRDFILEGGNMNSFIQKAKEIIIGIFNSITKAFSNVLNAMRDAVNVDKQLLKHSAEIREGYNKEWSFKNAYDFEKLNVAYEKPGDGFAKTLSDKYEAVLTKAMDGQEWKNEDALDHGKIASAICGIEIAGDNKTAGTMVKALADKTFVRVDYAHDGTKVGVETVLKMLNDGSATSAIRKAYGEIKAAYKETLKFIEGMKKVTGKKDEKEERKNFDACVVACARAATYEKNCQQVLFNNALKAAKTRQAQARKMAAAWYRAGKKTEKKEEAKAKEVSESALFNITII